MRNRSREHLDPSLLEMKISSEPMRNSETIPFDADGREVGRANGIFVKSRTPLSEKIGYR